MTLDREDRKNILYDKLNSDLLIKSALFKKIDESKHPDQRLHLAYEMEEIRRQINDLGVDGLTFKIIH